jgi:hypothetical protein
MLAVGGFLFAVYQYQGQIKENERQLLKEAAKPFWDEQIKLYLRSAQAAATIATSRDEATKAQAEEDFWILYWGPLAAVEDVGTAKNAVEAAMVDFGKYLKETAKNARDRLILENRSLNLAHVVRQAIGPSFDLKAAPPAYPSR